MLSSINMRQGCATAQGLLGIDASRCNRGHAAVYMGLGCLGTKLAAAAPDVKFATASLKCGAKAANSAVALS